MNIIKSIHPTNLFRSKKHQPRLITKSAPASFNTVSSDSSASTSSSSDPNYLAPPKTRRSSTAPPRPPSDVGDGDFWLELVEAFKLIDRDGDGKITRSELESVLSQIGAAPPSEEEMKTMFAEIDTEDDGCISLEEFGAISEAFGPASGTEELREVFEVFDADCDGRISAEELLRVLAAIGDERCTLEDCRRMIESVDGNGDGFVCFEDFKRMMRC